MFMVSFHMPALAYLFVLYRLMTFDMCVCMVKRVVVEPYIMKLCFE